MQNIQGYYPHHKVPEHGEGASCDVASGVLAGSLNSPLLEEEDGPPDGERAS